MSQEQDHYSVLGLKAKATAIEVRTFHLFAANYQMTWLQPELCDRSNELTATCASSAPRVWMIL